ncbi:PucR family transcriptional regulator [Gordonia sp. CPCC 205333]|uniref:PucR family transcriptional regulator n=1 Tax=Gordonia sp. CPCC 205333 TaxID=3140790 RepID=UPI003AF38B1B
MDKARDMVTGRGVRLSELLSALGNTVESSVGFPNVDPVVASVALLDADDVHLGVGPSARAADIVLFVGLDVATIAAWFRAASDVGSLPTTVLAKNVPAGISDELVAAGVVVVAIDPRARSERIYNVISRVLDDAVVGDTGRSGRVEDLFTLAAEVARQTGGLVNIEDERAQLLAYSTADERADELRRLSILGREGPPEMMAWLRRWGVLDAVRKSTEVVAVTAHPDLGLQARLAMPIRSGSGGEFYGTIWLQRAGHDWAQDVEQVLRGAAALAGRVIARRRAAGTAHDDLVRRLLGAFGSDIDFDYLATEFNLSTDTEVMLVAFSVLDESVSETITLTTSELAALTLHASAIAPLSLTAAIGARVYAVVPTDGLAPNDIRDWADTAVTGAARLFGRRIRAVVAGPTSGLRGIVDLRVQADRVLDAAIGGHHLIDDVTTVEASQTGVLLGEIVSYLAMHPDLVDSRVRAIAAADRETGGSLSASLRAYLDRFGDVRKAAQDLNIHPNTLRYRIRRVGEISGLDLDDSATRLVVALSLRVV